MLVEKVEDLLLFPSIIKRPILFDILLKIDFQETRQLSVKAAGGNADKVLVITADVTKEEDTKRIVAETVKKFGQLDVLVKNLCLVMIRG